MKHLLVTNDFPPKHGGIQSYLWELWRRLPPEETVVFTTSFEGAEAWDAEQAFRVVRGDRVLLPTPQLGRAIDRLADEEGAELVVLDPALPLGLLGPHLRHRYGLVLHGAEVTVPGRLPPVSLLLRHVLRGASVVIAAGGYPLAEAERAAGRSLPATNVPPGVDGERFRPLDPSERDAARDALGLPRDAQVVLGLSRLVPRKGFDMLLRASKDLGDDVLVAIGGGGRDRDRLERVARESGANAKLLGRVPEELLPAAHGCADVFAMLCRNRWAGLEQEGFGIVFLEAAACAVPEVAGASGGSDEAVLEGETGFVVDPNDAVATVSALRRLLGDESLRTRMGAAARERAVTEFSYDGLARRLRSALEAVGG